MVYVYSMHTVKVRLCTFDGGELCNVHLHTPATHNARTPTHTTHTHVHTHHKECTLLPSPVSLPTKEASYMVSVAGLRVELLVLCR